MAIKFQKLSYEYSSDTPLAYVALKDITLDISKGRKTAIIGATGSGKSTLVQHLNALLLPTSGSLEIEDWLIIANEKPKNLKQLRKQVGLVFQFPEYQLFEETVAKDIAFGPLNFGKTEEEAAAIAIDCLKLVGLPSSYLDSSPLELSGGEKRRVAIAGILAIEPDILVLDEPTAGLDPAGSVQMMQLFNQINKRYKKTILMVTHDLQDVVNYCDDVVVLDSGKVLGRHTVEQLFSDDTLLSKYRLNPPAIVKFQQALVVKGVNWPKRYLNMPSLVEALLKEFGSE